MDLGISGKRAFVTGASQGIGRAIAEALAAEGVKVIISSRNRDKCAEEALNIAQKYNTEAHGISCDLSNSEDIERAVNMVQDLYGGVDILVNNTGGPPFGAISKVDVKTWRDQFESMVLSVFRLTDLILPGMRAQNWGRVIIVSSTGVVEPIPELGISNTLRVSLANWAKTLSYEIAKNNITINMLMPGRIGTERLENLYKMNMERTGKTIEQVKKDVASVIPIGRVGRPEEFASLAVFLASENASYITGTATPIDGGLTRSIL
ncbi:MAG: 3-oxoacyl-ACP reductase [Rhodospirillaceae bacterium]|nr:3-oxoacyl-ACP reductase [Rhodospirillaceae bacterium]|tara:strand:- start:1380 stop:2171 length:792 start_codon:yes stop_codon:yes gene_type:complete